MPKNHNLRFIGTATHPGCRRLCLEDVYIWNLKVLKPETPPANSCTLKNVHKHNTQDLRQEAALDQALMFDQMSWIHVLLNTLHNVHTSRDDQNFSQLWSGSSLESCTINTLNTTHKITQILRNGINHQSQPGLSVGKVSRKPLDKVQHNSCQKTCRYLQMKHARESSSDLEMNI